MISLLFSIKCDVFYVLCTRDQPISILVNKSLGGNRELTLYFSEILTFVTCSDKISLIVPRTHLEFYTFLERGGYKLSGDINIIFVLQRLREMHPFMSRLFPNYVFEEKTLQSLTK